MKTKVRDLNPLNLASFLNIVLTMRTLVLGLSLSLVGFNFFSPEVAVRIEEPKSDKKAGLFVELPEKEFVLFESPEQAADTNKFFARRGVGGTYAVTGVTSF